MASSTENEDLLGGSIVLIQQILQKQCLSHVFDSGNGFNTIKNRWGTQNLNI